uniref:(northern house mosquito) hypothetical protein n=1 Tax=Culex pipiens TaxID=7175 RepID=A0A8D8BNA1_CULPI
MLTVRPTRCVSCAASVSRRSKVCRSTLLRSTRGRSCLVVPFVRGTLTRARTCILTRKICTPRNGKRRNWARSRLHPLLDRVRQLQKPRRTLRAHPQLSHGATLCVRHLCETIPYNVRVQEAQTIPRRSGQAENAVSSLYEVVQNP